MKVYGVWYMTEDGSDDLQGIYSTKTRARKALENIDDNKDMFYISEMDVDSEDTFTFDVKGEVVD